MLARERLAAAWLRRQHLIARMHAVEVLGLYARAMGEARKPRVRRVTPDVLLHQMRGVRVE